MAVINGGVQRSDALPMFTGDFQFYPGDYVYFTFYISGFATKNKPDTEVKSLSLEYEVTPEDSNHVPLTEPETGAIADTLTAKTRTGFRSGAHLFCCRRKSRQASS